MRGCVYLLLLLLLLTGCERQVKIDKHFKLSTFDVEGLSLMYLNNKNQMFSIVKSEIVAYLKCGNHIYIVQHPLDGNGKPDDHLPEYFILDTSIDYSNDKLKPYSISESRFKETLEKECNGESLKDL